MALQLKLTQGAFVKTTNTLSLTDTTGNYNAVDNPAGYGAPNEERANLALVISGRRYGSTAEDVQWDDPLLDSAFEYVFGGDASYEIFLCGLPIEATPDVSLLAEGYVYYDSDADQIFKIELVGGVKTAVETSDVIDNSSYVSEIQYFLVTSQLEKKKIDLFCSSFDEGVCEPIKEEYNDLSRVIDAIGCRHEEGYYKDVAGLVTFGNKIRV